MKNQNQSFSKINGSIVLTAIIFAISISLTTGCGEKESSKQSNGMKIQKKEESIVRDGEIDLNEIDINKDSKVFQDPMHWNVISDEAGKCPLCKMTLEEVTLESAKSNLMKNGFKVK